MKLWTFHKPDFSITEGRVDHTKSSYFQTVAGVPDAYCELWKRVGTDQIIWCFTSRKEAETGMCEVEWSLDVPDSDILAFVDGFVWNRILEIRCHVPRRLYQHWRSEALSLYPNNLQERDKFVDAKTEDYWSQEPPEDGWWSCLFVDDPAGEAVSALIRHPVPEEWVMSHIASHSN